MTSRFDGVGPRKNAGLNKMRLKVCRLRKTLSMPATNQCKEITWKDNV